MFFGGTTALRRRTITLTAVTAVTASLAVVVTAAPSAASSPTTTRVSLTSTGAQSKGGASDAPSVSSNGRYVAFASTATNLVPGDTNAASDVFVRDTVSGTTTLVSVGAGGVPANGASDQPSISGDGRYVAFRSAASNLVASDTNGHYDVFVRDLVAGTTSLVSQSTGGTQGDNDSAQPFVSATGRYIVFQSLADNLISADQLGKQDIFLRDTQLGTTERVSLSMSNGSPAGPSAFPSVSADGRWVAFQSGGFNITGDCSTGTTQIYVRDRQSGTNYCLTDGVNIHAYGNGASTHPQISSDGSTVVWTSVATNLVSGDTNGNGDVFERAATGGPITLVSKGPGSTQSDGVSDWPSVDAVGRMVAFDSTATDLVSGDTNAVGDTFVWDNQQKTMTRADVTSAGVQATAVSTKPEISATGQQVVFRTTSALVSNDTNGAADAYERDLGTLPNPDLATTISGTPNPATVGANVVYTVGVKNNGTAADTATTVTIPLPSNATFVTGSAPGGACTLAASTVTCPLGALAISASASAQVTMTGTSVGSLSVTATASSPQADLNTADNAATTSTNITLPDLTVTPSVAANPVDTAANVVATAVVKNNGLVNASNAVLSVTLPANTTAVSANVGATSCTLGATVSCPLGTIAPGAQVSATVTVSSATEQNVVLPFVAGENENDLNPSDNSASTSAVVGRPDLTTTLAASIEPVPYGANVTYTATIKNTNGTAQANAAHVTFTRPSGTTIQSANSSGGCTVTSTGADCQLGVIAVGGSATATFTVQNTGGGSASVTADGEPAGQTDRNSADNATSLNSTFAAAPAPDLSAGLTLGPNPSPLGNNLTSTLTVSNIGSSNATSTTATLTNPSNATITNAVLDNSTACTVTSSGALCSFGTLAGGATRTATITYLPSAEGTVTATVSVATPDGDQNLSNNTASASVTVGSPDLSPAITPTPSTVTLGSTTDEQVVVSNNGTAPAVDAQVSIPIPSGTTLVNSSGTGCTAASTAVTCDFGAMPISGSATAHLTLQPTAAGTVTLSATTALGGGQADKNTSNDTASTPLPVVAPDLATTLSTSPSGTVKLGNTITYTAGVTNNGTTTASSAVLSLPLPANTSFTSTGSSAGCSSDGVTVTCTLGDIAATGSTSATIVLTPSHLGNVAATATASSATPDANTADNAATANITVQAPDLAITIAPGNLYVVVGKTVKYVTTVTNNGNDTAQNVTVTLPQPSGATITATTTGHGTCSGTNPAVCNIGTVAAGSSYNISTTIQANAEQYLTESASATTSPTVENNPGDNSGSVQIKSTMVSETPDQTYQTNGKVSTIVKVGNIIYMGGEFTSMRPARAPLGTGEVQRMYGGSIDYTTGMLASWDPEFDDVVESMVLSPDGTTLYVAGDFRHVGAVARAHIAAFNASTGALLAWAPNFDSVVHQITISADGQYIYAGGAFQNVNGTSQPWSAKVTTATGALVPAYAPSISYPEFPGLTMVRSVAMSLDGSSVYIGGVFDLVNGQTHQSIVKVDSTTGLPDAGWDPGMQKKVNKNTSQVYVVVPTTNYIFLCGDFYSVGGIPTSNLAAVSPTNGQLSPVWENETDGAVNACAVSGTRLYIGGHFDWVGGPNADIAHPNPGQPLTGVLRHHLASLSLTPIGAPIGGEALLWQPDANSAAGIYSLLVTPTYVYAGGDFTQTGHYQAQQGYAQFAGTP
jgi:uncharacterized repeat protein (TIGR01451 family)